MRTKCQVKETAFILALVPACAVCGFCNLLDSVCELSVISHVLIWSIIPCAYVVELVDCFE